MSKWNVFFKENDGNNFPHNSLVSFFFKNIYKIKKKKSISLIWDVEQAHL
tara:strand:+ start:424 stop:573 length:150 start_codon:yes stop_codon:yes gene_type:complete